MSFTCVRGLMLIVRLWRFTLGFRVMGFRLCGWVEVCVFLVLFGLGCVCAWLSVGFYYAP